MNRAERNATRETKNKHRKRNQSSRLLSGPTRSLSSVRACLLAGRIPPVLFVRDGVRPHDRVGCSPCGIQTAYSMVLEFLPAVGECEILLRNNVTLAWRPRRRVERSNRWCFPLKLRGSQNNHIPTRSCRLQAR